MNQAVQTTRLVLGFALALSALLCAATTWDGFDLPRTVAWYPEFLLDIAFGTYAASPVIAIFAGAALGVAAGIFLMGFERMLGKVAELAVVSAGFVVPVEAVRVSFDWWHGDGFPWWLGGIPAALGFPATHPENWPGWVAVPVIAGSVIGSFALYLIVVLGGACIIGVVWNRIRTNTPQMAIVEYPESRRTATWSRARLFEIALVAAVAVVGSVMGYLAHAAG